MTKTHYKRLINPDYLGAYSLDNGQGGYLEIVPTIASIKVETVTGTDGKKENCMVMRFKESRIGTVDMKPMILNVTNAKTLEKLYKTPYVEDWADRKVTIGVEKVKAFGEILDALRIRKTLPREQGTPKCLDCGGSIEATEKMTAIQIVAVTQKRYGKTLCAQCWMKLAEQEKADPVELAESAATVKSEQSVPPGAEPGESEFEKLMREGQG